MRRRPAPVRLAATAALTAYPLASVNPSIRLLGGTSVVRVSRAPTSSSANASICGTIIGRTPFCRYTVPGLVGLQPRVKRVVADRLSVVIAIDSHADRSRVKVERPAGRTALSPGGIGAHSPVRMIVVV